MSNMDNIIEIPCEESDGEFEKNTYRVITR